MFGYRSEIAFCIILLVISLTFVVLRLYIRYWGGSNERRILKRPAPYLIGDLLMVVAWVLSASYGCAHVYFRVNQVSNAEAAKTDPEVAMAVMILSMKVRAHQSVSATIAIYSIKASFLCVFYCTPVSVDAKLRRTLLAVTCFTVAAFIIVFGFIFRCGPISTFWELGPGNCYADRPREAISLFCGLHLATDFALMAVGYVLVSRSRTLTGRVWFGVMFIFFLIFLTVIINSVRLAVAILMLNLGGRTDGRSNAYAQAMVLLCLAELNVGLIAVTLPSFRVLWRKIQAKRATAVGSEQSKDVLGFEKHKSVAVFEDVGGILAEEDERAMALTRISSNDIGNGGSIEMELM